MTEKLQHEVELVVALRAGGSNIPVEQALDCVFGYAVGFDMTRRDLQAQAKEKGQPWDMGKGLDQGGRSVAILPLADAGHPNVGHLAQGQRRTEADR